MTHHAPHRGFALLLVVAALVVIATAVTIGARLASTLHAERSVGRDMRLANDLLHAADDIIVRWLDEEAGQVVLPASADQPRVHVFDDTWTIDGVPYAIVITAWDQEGMVPWSVARSASPLRLALAADVLRLLDDADIDPDAVVGLDLIADAFPMAEGEARFGALVASHSASPARINVLTAPRALVEAAYRTSGRSGVELVWAARDAAEQRVALPAGSGRSGGGGGGADSIMLTTRSNAWAFRIDIGVGDARRSWWVIYERTRSGWELRQRLVITA